MCNLDSIVDDEVIPSCCDNMKIEIIKDIKYGMAGTTKEDIIYQHFCTNCGSMRPELD